MKISLPQSPNALSTHHTYTYILLLFSFGDVIIRFHLHTNYNECVFEDTNVHKILDKYSWFRGKMPKRPCYGANSLVSM